MEELARRVSRLKSLESAPSRARAEQKPVLLDFFQDG